MSEGDREDKTTSLGSAELCLALLELLAEEAHPLGVTEVARCLGTSKSRAYRTLRILVSRGYARQDAATEAYEIGTKPFLIGEAVRERFEILAASRPEMNALREATGHAVTLSTVIDGDIVVLELLQGKNFIEWGTRPGTRVDAHATAQGKIALAFGPAAVRARLAGGRLRVWTPKTITDFATLDAGVAQVRRHGWATADGEFMYGSNALAAPVFDHRNGYQGALAMVGPSHAIPAKPAAAQIEQVRQVAQRISERLGWHGAVAPAKKNPAAE